MMATQYWRDALCVARCFNIAPLELGGVVIHSGAGEVRDRWMQYLLALDNLPSKKIPCSITDEQLLGGLDLSATLVQGKPVALRGALASVDRGVLIIAMAERLNPQCASLIAKAMDAGHIKMSRDGVSLNYAAQFGVLALDEGLEGDPALPASIKERCALYVDFTGLTLRGIDSDQARQDLAQIQAIDWPAIRLRYQSCSIDTKAIEVLCRTAEALKVDSIRAPMLASRVARAHASLNGRSSAQEEDLAFAVRFVLAPRALALPEQATQESEPHEKSDPPPENSATPDNNANDLEKPVTEQEVQQLQDAILQAAVASIPDNLLASIKLQAQLGKVKKAGNSGAKQRAGMRGKASGSFRKKPSPQSRIHLLETLRASIVWQKIRSKDNQKIAGNGAPQKVHIRKEDFRYKRIEQKTLSTIIFAIDASGSSALHRLAEAKGAIELLLAQCYVRRDQVAVIAFRGKTSEVILPPTRSLARAKRSLAGLPGGGGTPLAAALDSAATVASSVRRKGESPFLVMLTDGRANVARTEGGNRAQAQIEARQAAQLLRYEGLAAIVLDTSPQPHPMAQQLAGDLGAIYMPLPRADSKSVSSIVQRAYRASL